MAAFAPSFSPEALRSNAAAIFQAGIDAADPYCAVERCLTVNAGQLNIALQPGSNAEQRRGHWQKIHLLAFGKAACAMAKAARDIVPAELFADDGIVVTNYENITPVDGCVVLGAGHPLPDAAGLTAAEKVLNTARQAKANELLLVMISGGGSALLPCPLPPITLQDKIATTQLLLSCGATIGQINCVRKHLSQLKGGGLARIAAPAELHALILSDVLGDDLSAIASGPTVPDETTFSDAITVLKSANVWEQTPQTVREVLQAGLRGEITETPKPGDPLFERCGHTLIGSNALSLKAITAAAEARGYHSYIYSDRLCGEARTAADALAIYAQNLTAQSIDRPTAILAGGETTVTLRGNGIGGRNQEMALAFALAAEKQGLPNCWTFLSGGTDGRDGPTDAAGGIVDPDSLQRMRSAGLDPAAALASNDSHTALQAAHDLLVTGATGTNVADLQILLIYPFS